MFLTFFTELRAARFPVTLREYLTLMEALDQDLADKSVEDFYFLSRACLVKDERNLDKFDRVFGRLPGPGDVGPGARSAPFRRSGCGSSPSAISPRRRSSRSRPWAGQAARDGRNVSRSSETTQRAAANGSARRASPFGAYGYNPEGIRIGQDGNRNFRAVKVWDKREFKDFDDGVELGVRNMRIALRRLRRFARTGAAEELDLDGTIHETAHKGYLDVKLRPGAGTPSRSCCFWTSADPWTGTSRSRRSCFPPLELEFKHFEHFYFHNCLYERVWKENRRRFDR